MLDRSPGARQQPDRTPQPVVRKIVRLRWKLRLGSVEIADRLGMQSSTACAVLLRCRLNRLMRRPCSDEADGAGPVGNDPDPVGDGRAVLKLCTVHSSSSRLCYRGAAQQGKPVEVRRCPATVGHLKVTSRSTCERRSIPSSPSWTAVRGVALQLGAP
jgi:hypothetical protein